MKLLDINFELATAEFHCDSCNGKGIVGVLGCDPDWCNSCSGDGVVVVWFQPWLDNLYAVGALQLAFELGRERGYASCPCEGYRDDELARHWRPNTDGKAAPGWEGKS